MPIRLQITLLFFVLSFIILSTFCLAVYYFSYTARMDAMKSRLMNKANTTSNLLSEKETFDHSEMQLIDSSTAISIKNKNLVAYNNRNIKIYEYTDRINDHFVVKKKILDLARKHGTFYFTQNSKEAVAIYNKTIGNVVIAAGEDIYGNLNLFRLRNILIINFIGGIIVVLLIGYFFSGKLLKPIKIINSDLAEISAQNLTRRIAISKTKDEWQQLTLTLNDLLNRLQESFELQRRFISNASHELATPLTSISSQLEITLQRERDSNMYRNIIESTYQDVQNMSRLTGILLQFAKAAGNNGGLEISTIRIDEVVLRIPSEVKKINSSYTVKIDFDKLPDEEETLFVLGNEALLLTAIKNIISNACKYSENNKAIVRLETSVNALTIKIVDTGIGIKDENLSNIFQPFYRVEENMNTDGFGLGLSLAEQIIKLHKGSICVSSELGKGSVFSIHLPIIDKAIFKDTMNCSSVA